MPAEIVVAIDVGDRGQAVDLVDALSAPGVDARFFKVGPQLFLARGCGRGFVEELTGRGLKVFLDLKLFDIPTTVNTAAREIMSMQVWSFTVHALGGEPVLRAAVAGARGRAWAGLVSEEGAEGNGHSEMAKPRPLVFALTTLTSEAGPSPTSSLAAISARCGADGLVMPGTELSRHRSRYPGMVFVVPGVRPGASRDGKARVSRDDQVRTIAPEDAQRLGADYLVVGRPIIASRDPVGTYLSIRQVLEAEKPVAPLQDLPGTATNTTYS